MNTNSLETTLKPLIKDFVNDLTTTFPEKSYLWEHLYEPSEEVLVKLQEYFVKVYPERFFDILYQNEEIFKDAKINTCFLPHVQFSELFQLNITENTKQTLWKYLQLILLQISGNINNPSSFGEAANIFQGIDETELQDKLGETLEGLKEFFAKPEEPTDPDSKMPPDAGNEPEKKQFPFEKMFDNLNTDNIQEHLKKLMGGKIGSMVEELVEEMKDELSSFESEMGDIDPNNISMPDIMKKLMKNPTKMMAIMKKMADKVKTKMRENGNQEDIMKETADILKTMGGKDEFMKMFEQMRKGMPGGGKNMKVDENALNRMQRGQKMKERMRQNIVAKKQKDLENNPLAIIEKTGSGKVFRIQGEAPTEKSTKEDIDKIMKDLGLDEPKPEPKLEKKPEKKVKKTKK